MSRYYAGCELTDYEKYMISLRDELPMINIFGAYTEQDGYISTNSFDGIREDLKKAIYDYSCVEYHNIYEK
jgi:hypothetical protein